MAYGGMPGPFRALVALSASAVGNINLAWNEMYGIMFLNLSASLGYFYPRAFFSKKNRIGQVTADLLYIRFEY